MKDLVKTYFGLKKSGDISDKLKAKDFNVTSLSTFDFSTLYTALPRYYTKDNFIDIIERILQ